MFLSRSALLIEIIVFLNVGVMGQMNQSQYQPVPSIQQPTPHVPLQQDMMQQNIIQQQPIQAQPMKTPLYGMPNPGQQNSMEQPHMNQPAPRVATARTPQTLYGQYSAPVNQTPVNNTALPQTPAHQSTVFVLTSAEQQELDEFLVRWEKYSAGVKRYDVDFNLFIYNAAIPGSDPNKPHKVAYGYFKYIANPRRFVYVVEGEWQGDKQVKREGDKNPQVFAEKVIIDEKSVCKYDYNSKTVHQVNVPAELIGKGIADSPLPLIFGARADELKRRFSMKVVAHGELLRLYARPLLVEDQQEFRELEILLHKQNLTANGLRQWSTGGKQYNVYELRSPKVNDRLSFVADDLKSWFAKTIDRDWKYEVTDWVAVPSAAPAMPQPPIAYPQNRNEIPLYQMQ